jgi:hypothetical protein
MFLDELGCQNREILRPAKLIHEPKLRHVSNESLIAAAGGVRIVSVVKGDSGIGVGPDQLMKHAVVSQCPRRQEQPD